MEEEARLEREHNLQMLEEIERKQLNRDDDTEAQKELLEFTRNQLDIRD